MRVMLQIGDEVVFSRTFLHNTGQYTGWAPFASGRVEAWENGNGFPKNKFVYVKWEGKEGPRMCCASNLIRKDRRHLEPV